MTTRGRGLTAVSRSRDVLSVRVLTCCMLGRRRDAVDGSIRDYCAAKMCDLESLAVIPNTGATVGFVAALHVGCWTNSAVVQVLLQHQQKPASI